MRWLLLVLVGCSSIPEVSFVDRDASVSPDAGRPGPPAEAGTDSGRVEPAFACPDKPPPNGLCCANNVACIRCTSCNECNAERCAAGFVCCPQGARKVNCERSCD